ncbi:3'(2'),5'-bisphosphate nucleotidase CysQ [Bermanella marisrubri]|uniref:3'(2'),5'-bisphosphate nucleotidase CysQ n=1 Tax=Bermanella marisrubri TaxID=207949 RepID=Q1MYI0_9GAMM|nr:3'(2'),5'-bisphosphate nucleotidase CysQ [Bermanella marisrubri]EAT11051.1 3'(2'),5'-bisphosphate nucleotidase [Oceanobacter sp. RED65] [Bermanella marisrubri]QIZ82966.1 3'(2'),5'-bisphosphate nucleotidase CysQ [Bermanella marisrubri]
MQPNYEAVMRLAKLAGEAIITIYERSDYTTVTEKEDNSPLTDADLAANQIICDGLQSIADIPIISEEAHIPDQEVRKQWQRFWLVDPLDGTKEFIDRNGEFTVNIALIEEGQPTFGLIYAPVLDTFYYGGDDKAYMKKGDEPAVSIKPSQPLSQIRESNTIRMFVSRRHTDDQMELLRDRLEEKLAHVAAIPLGSSLKIAQLANGEGELYPRFGNVSEWDIAAGHAILRAAGGEILSRQFEGIEYGRKPSMIVPGFFAVGSIDFDWRPILLT